MPTKRITVQHPLPGRVRRFSESGESETNRRIMTHGEMRMKRESTTETQNWCGYPRARTISEPSRYTIQVLSENHRIIAQNASSPAIVVVKEQDRRIPKQGEAGVMGIEIIATTPR